MGTNRGRVGSVWSRRAAGNVDRARGPSRAWGRFRCPSGVLGTTSGDVPSSGFRSSRGVGGSTCTTRTRREGTSRLSSRGSRTSSSTCLASSTHGRHPTPQKPPLFSPTLSTPESSPRVSTRVPSPYTGVAPVDDRSGHDPRGYQWAELTFARDSRLLDRPSRSRSTTPICLFRSV